jgi:SpoVK/Ycf46/Vps4 family AAA+-type ATPase
LRYLGRDQPRGSAMAISPDGRPLEDLPARPDLPAQPLTTLLEWDDLVLDAATLKDVGDIVGWARHEAALMDDWGLRKRLKPGYRCLFHGPPGTGKTLAAALIGKALGREVSRVDLSKVVSKYIGETEKQLDDLFDQARLRNWILFFDEADAIFGKRTAVRDAHDRFADQQTAYLLQRIEDHIGVVIAASNLDSHLDETFVRRLQSVVRFALPDAEQRARLWRDCLKDKPVAADIDLRPVAKDYVLSGGAIVEAVRHACLRAVERNPSRIRNEDITEAARRQLRQSNNPGR